MGIPTVRVRSAAVEDSDGVWSLVQDFATSYEPDERAFRQSFNELLFRSDTLVLVAEEDDRTIAGYLLASHHGTFHANGPVAWIEEVMVAESARTSGVGRRMMAEAERWATSIPVAYVALASRRAGGFYRRIGYHDSAIYFKKLPRIG